MLTLLLTVAKLMHILIPPFYRGNGPDFIPLSVRIPPSCVVDAHYTESTHNIIVKLRGAHKPDRFHAQTFFTCVSAKGVIFVKINYR